jgi:hypothetical protein
MVVIIGYIGNASTTASESVTLPAKENCLASTCLTSLELDGLYTDNQLAEDLYEEEELQNICSM